MTDVLTKSPLLQMDHPGAILRDEFLEPMAMSVSDLAKCLNVDRSTVSRVTTGKASITPDFATRLELCLGASAEFWLNLQAAYDLWQVRDKDFNVMSAKEFLAA